ncbi:MAG: T9SS type A sorting domain-containing protein [Bacteroidales bacterium]|nr:T9SS type A sorting domain-containing protein [Bacteroidales bacterium]
MAKRLFLAVLVLLFGFNAFSQIEIWSETDFRNIKNNVNGNYVQKAPIDLGSIGDTSDAIIGTEFKGTYDGGGFTITYSASFNGTTITGDYGLFSTVSGTIKNLNVNANVTLGGSATAMNVALLCGYLKQNGLIEFCNVSGNVNSTVNAELGGGSDAGLIVGESKGKIKYCNASGNVVGVGYAGGIVGQLTSPAEVKGCAFTGSVTALDCARQTFSTWGSFAGGICGFANTGTTIDLCYSNADIVAGKQSHGAVSTNTATWWEVLTGIVLGSGTPSVTNNYCAGTVNGENLDSSDDITNSVNVSGNYYEGQGQMSAQDIADALNQAAAGDTNIYFSVVNGKVVFGRVEMICETPINLVVDKNGNNFVVEWGIANADATVNETKWHWTLIGNNIETRAGTTTENRVECNDLPSPVGVAVYTFTVYTDCSEIQDDLLSNSVSTKIYMFGFQTSHCYSVEKLSYSNVGVTNATISWEKNANSTSNRYQIVLNEDEPIEQSDMTITFENLQPGTTYNVEVREQCNQNGEDDVWGNPRTVSFTTLSYYETATTGNFNAPETWKGSRVPTGNVGVIKINEKHIVELSHTLVLKNDCQIINDGVLKIKQQGELVNTTENNVGGIVEIETPQKSQNNWTFIGAPFAGYKLECIKPAPSADISISKYDYTQGDWSNEWATVSTEMEAAEGYFAWPFYSGVVTYTTYGDVCVKNEETKIWEEKPYDFDKEPATELNNADITIEKEITENNGRWMALSNPYPAKLSVNKFVAANTDIAFGSEASEEGGNIQGQCIYKLTNNVSSNKQTWDVVFANTNETVKEIAMTEGFFVNLASGNSVTFSKTQLTNYPTTEAKSQVAPREFVELSLVKGKQKSKLYFAHNEMAEQNYDIFDANKLFALREVAEPYFLTDGNALVKEEVKELPYLATMNVRSFADDTVSFVVENIPEGYYVYLIDNGERIKMHEQIGYLTQIAEGENEDRFKILVTKTILEDSRAASNIEITNYNREITIESEVENLEIEVYNALGQKVFATKDYNFTLNEVPAGAYLVKAFSGKVRQTQKIVVK